MEELEMTSSMGGGGSEAGVGVAEGGSAVGPGGQPKVTTAA